MSSVSYTHLRLDLLKLGQQLVESSVRDLGRLEGVVAIGVVIEQVAQLGRARCGLSADVLRGLGSRRSAIRPRAVIRRHIAKQALLLRHVGLPDSQISTTTEYHRARMLRHATIVYDNATVPQRAQRCGARNNQ